MDFTIVYNYTYVRKRRLEGFQVILAMGFTTGKPPKMLFILHICLHAHAFQNLNIP